MRRIIKANKSKVKQRFPKLKKSLIVELTLNERDKAESSPCQVRMIV